MSLRPSPSLPPSAPVLSSRLESSSLTHLCLRPPRPHPLGLKLPDPGLVSLEVLGHVLGAANTQALYTPHLERFSRPRVIALRAASQ